jgi:hypothetical protein
MSRATHFIPSGSVLDQLKTGSTCRRFIPSKSGSFRAAFQINTLAKNFLVFPIDHAAAIFSDCVNTRSSLNSFPTAFLNPFHQVLKLSAPIKDLNRWELEFRHLAHNGDTEFIQRHFCHESKQNTIHNRCHFPK